MAKKEERKHTHTHIKPIWNSSTVLEMGVVFLLAAWFFFTLPTYTERSRSGFVFHLQAEPRDATHRFGTAATTQKTPPLCASTTPSLLECCENQLGAFTFPLSISPPSPSPPPLLFPFLRALPPCSPLPLSPAAADCSSRDGARSTRRFDPPPLPGGGCGHSLRGGAMRCRRSASATAPRL